jgi:hypothetical protein
MSKIKNHPLIRTKKIQIFFFPHRLSWLYPEGVMQRVFFVSTRRRDPAFLDETYFNLQILKKELSNLEI